MIPELRRRSAIDHLDQLGFFRHIQWLDQVDSTNRYLDRLIKADQIRLPSLVMADSQSAGAGRGSNRWYSPQGCLMFSMAIEHAQLSAQENPQSFSMLPLQIGLAVAQALTPMVRTRPKVKWPNDVYIQDRKVCGILIESSSIGDLGYAVIGIGINCQVDFDQAPDEVRQSAISVHEVLSQSNQEFANCESILIAFLQSWLQIRSECQSRENWIEQTWSDWDWLADRQIQIQQPNRTLIGKADGIAADGALRLIDSDANRHTILSGSVRVLDETNP
jgi:BirA family biotin operon repressor/biotin-[acetyl-CoA-carboxylase] ligase